MREPKLPFFAFVDGRGNLERSCRLTRGTLCNKVASQRRRWGQFSTQHRREKISPRELRSRENAGPIALSLVDHRGVDGPSTDVVLFSEEEPSICVGKSLLNQPE